jgi:hypothetical protein
MDIEKLAGGPTYLSGYPSLAGFIAIDQDQTSAIFKRFKRLCARNLLHLQSQIAELHAELDTFDYEEEERDLNTKQYSRNWETFRAAAEHDPRQKQKKVLLDKIGRTMGDYRKTPLLQFSKDREAYVSSTRRSTNLRKPASIVAATYKKNVRSLQVSLLQPTQRQFIPYIRSE